MKFKEAYECTAFDRLQLTEHIDVYPYAQKHVFMCRYCPTMFVQPSRLIKHITKTHEEKLNAHRS